MKRRLFQEGYVLGILCGLLILVTGCGGASTIMTISCRLHYPVSLFRHGGGGGADSHH